MECAGCVIGLFLFQMNDALSYHSLIAFEYEQPDVVKSRPFVELSDKGLSLPMATCYMLIGCL